MKFIYPKAKIINPPFHIQDELDQIISRLKKTNTKDKIIDFGAGSGRLSVPLLQKGYKVLAVDIDKSALKDLKYLAKFFNKDKNLKILNKIPDGRNQFQMIVGTDVLHHIDINKYFDIFYQVLRKSGKIIFSEPNFFHGLWWVYNTIFCNWDIEKGIIYCNYPNLVNKLKKSGFTNIKISGFGLLPPQFFKHFPLFRKLNYLFGNLPVCQYFAFRLIIEAEK